MRINHCFPYSLFPLSPTKYYSVLKLAFLLFQVDVLIKLESSAAPGPALLPPLDVIVSYAQVIKIFHYYCPALFLLCV